MPIPHSHIPKFIGGFMYGMTGENNLLEIEACYNGGDMIYHEVTYALDELHKHTTDGLIQAILQFGIVAL